jgi:hypothetical protein
VLTTVEVSVTRFDRVVLAGSGTVTIVTGRPSSLVAETDENLQQYIEASVEAGTLTIAIGRGVSLHPTDHIVYTASTESLAAVVLSGAGAVTR